jgi:hypothetical protein
MQETYPFIKYIFLFILFIFAFICLYSSRLEIIGFGSLFTIHVFFILSLIFDIYKDKERARKVFSLPSIKSGGVEIPEISIPIYLLIIPISLLQIRIVTLLCLNVWAIVEKQGFFRISRDNRYRIETIKTLTLITLIMLFAFILVYIQYNNIPMNNLSQFFIGICIIGTYVLSIVNTVLEMKASSEFLNTTDG